MIHLVQISHPVEGRRTAVVDGNRLLPLRTHRSVYACTTAAEDAEVGIDTVVHADLGNLVLEYDPVYDGRSLWKLLPAFDHPTEPARCLVSGTGLTHRKSAANRD